MIITYAYVHLTPWGLSNRLEEEIFLFGYLVWVPADLILQSQKPDPPGLLSEVQDNPPTEFQIELINYVNHVVGWKIGTGHGVMDEVRDCSILNDRGCTRKGIISTV